MRSSHLQALLTLLLLTLSAGCMSTYSPPGPVVPLFHNKGDLSIGANVRPAMPTRGANAYAAVAPSESTRAYVQGSFAHYDGLHAEDNSERKMNEMNHTRQVEAAAGWGLSKGNFAVEAFAGLGYGRTDANACHRNFDINGNYGVDCSLWITSSSWFVQPFVQAHAGWRKSRFGGGGGGLRASVLHYDFDQLMGAPSDRVANAVTLEPYLSGSIGLPWGKLELSLMVPLVVSSPVVQYTRRYDDYYSQPSEQTWTARLIDTASPRFTLGIRGDLHELWRKPQAPR
ncbi:MAG: hypothetical protein QM778_31320 [Myxococcales bacterium]